MTNWQDRIADNREQLKEAIITAVKNELIEMSATYYTTFKPEAFGVVMDRPEGSGRVNYMDLMATDILPSEVVSSLNADEHAQHNEDKERARHVINQFAERLDGKMGKKETIEELGSVIYSTRSESDFIEAINGALSEKNRIDVEHIGVGKHA